MIQQFKQQLNLFYLALSFYSRIPVPNTVNFTPELLNKSTRYFSLVGLCLACILSAGFFLFTLLLPISVTVVLIMIISLLLTGAFHEDGLADMSDGIGGNTIEQRILIMKDSRIGSYGAISIIMALLLKYQLLIELANQQFLIAGLFLGYALSRAIAASFMFDMSYAGSVNSKSVAVSKPQSATQLYVLMSIAALPLLYFSITTVLAVIASLMIFRLAFKKYLTNKLSGYNGDCLGAAQQLSELIIYVVLVAMNIQQLTGSNI